MSKFGRFGAGFGKFGRSFVGRQIVKLPNDSGRINEISTTFGDFRGGFNSAQLRDGTPQNASVNAVDVDLTKRGRLTRIAGNTIIESLTHIAAKMVLHPSLDGWANLVFFSEQFVGVKGRSTTAWTSVLPASGDRYTSTLFGEDLIFYNGAGSPFIMHVGQPAVEAPTIPGANAYAVFANRVYAGGLTIEGKYQPMGIGWSSVSGDPKDFTGDGANTELLIDNPISGDHVVTMKTMGLNLMAILCRHSIWNAAFTGISDRPADFSPRVTGSGCVAEDTAQATPAGVIYLSDDGLHAFDGNVSPNISAQINGEILPLGSGPYSSSFDPKRNRYTLHTPTESWTYDLTEQRWLKSSMVALSGVLYGTQLGGVTWAEITGDWSDYAGVRWRDLERHEADDADMHHINVSGKLAKTDIASTAFFGAALTPLWDTPQTRGFTLTNLNETKAIIIEYIGSGTVHVSLPNINAEFKRVYSNAILPVSTIPAIGWLPIVHTGLTTGVRLEIATGDLQIVQIQLLTQTVSPKLPGIIVEDIPVVPVPTDTDAILRPLILFTDTFDAGKLQVTGRYKAISSTFTYHETGGDNDGGCITFDSNNTILTVEAPPPAGSDYGDATLRVLEGPGEDPPRRWGGHLTVYDLQGIEPTQDIVLQNYNNHVYIKLLTDRTIRAYNVDTSGLGDDVLTPLGAATTQKVPLTGRFTIESQVGISPYDTGIDFGYPKGGFCIVNLYHDDSPDIGYPVVRAIGVRTRQIGDSVVPPGINDQAVSGPLNAKMLLNVIYTTGGPTLGWLYNLYGGVALPIADVSVQSEINYAHSEIFHGAPPQSVGMNLVWGTASRFLNVLDKTLTAVASLFLEFALGDVSSFTDAWLDGAPFYPPTPDSVVRNSYFDDDQDLMQVEFNRDGILEIVAITPFATAGLRNVTGAFTSPLSIGGRLPWFFSGRLPASNLAGGDPRPYSTSNSTYRLIIKNGGVVQNARVWRADQNWAAQPGYNVGPYSVLSADSVTGEPFDPDNLPSLGVKGDFIALDAIDPTIDPADRWNKFDIGLLGMDIIYRLVKPLVSVDVQYGPIADIVFHSNGSDLPHGSVVVYDNSVDFNQGFDQVISGVTARVIDWGDGQSEDIQPGFVNRISHTYLLHGTKTVTLTVRNNLGLVATDTLQVVIPVGAVLANFSFAGDEIDDQKILFTDLSVSQNGTIIARSWAFGDATTSASQNPQHIYAAPGTYTVSLTVTDDSLQTNTITVDIEVPVPVAGSDCAGFDTVPGAFVQGDDWAGGNPPLPAYANLAAFESYYFGSTLRRAYDNAYANGLQTGVSYDLDTSVLFNGHPTWKMVFGNNPAPAHGTWHIGAGWDTVLTDDGDPTETLYGTPSGPQKLWTRIRWKADADIMQDGSIADGDNYAGLAVLSFDGSNVSIGFLVRNGKLFLDTHLRESLGGGRVNHQYDLGAYADFVGAAGFGELGIHLDGDNTAHTIRIRVFAGPACTLGGVVDPILDQVAIAYTGSSGGAIAQELSVDTVEHFNWFFTPTGDNKNLHVADWRHEPGEFEDDPYGYLTDGGGPPPPPRAHFDLDHFPSDHFADDHFG